MSAKSKEPTGYTLILWHPHELLTAVIAWSVFGVLLAFTAGFCWGMSVS
jgi:hypothetical protein